VGADAETALMPPPVPVRVLHVRDSPWIDGPGRTILETASSVDPARIDFHMGAFVSAANAPHPFVEEARRRRLAIHPIPDAGGLSAQLIERIVALIDEHQIDVLHTSEFRSNVMGLLVRRRRPKLRLIATVHGWISNDVKGKVYRFADKVLLRWFDAAIFVSEATRAKIPRWWLREGRALVLRNALVMSNYADSGIGRRAFPAEGDIRLLSVGRLSPEKAQDLLLRVVAGLMPRYPRLRLRIVGIGPLEEPLRELARSLGIAAHVEFAGFVQNMRPEYENADLVVQSSLTEGLPNVILEAAMLGVPILATDVGGTSEVVEHSRGAWLIPAGSQDALMDGLVRFLENPDAFAAMARAARTSVEAHFSFATRTENLTDIYAKILGRPQ
jgi:glycosyltransferase involved in cell wall biosynthesis